MKAKLIAINVPSTDHSRIGKFYSKLLGLDLARSFTEEMTSYHMPLSNDGQFLFISDRSAEDEQISCMFAVDDLEESKADLTGMGGKVFVDNIDLPISPKMMDFYSKNDMTKENITKSIGKTALIRDPEGSVIALVQLEEHARLFFNAVDVNNYLSHAVLATHRDVKLAGSALE